MRMRPVSEAGFNLIELIITLAILSLLAGAAVFSFSGSKSKGQILFTTMTDYGSAMNRLLTDMSCYPTNTGALFNKTLAEQNNCGGAAAAETWHGPYTKTAPLAADNANILMPSIGATVTLTIHNDQGDINGSGNTTDWFLQADNVPNDIAMEAYKTCNNGRPNGPCGNTAPAKDSSGTGMSSVRYIFDETS